MNESDDSPTRVVFLFDVDNTLVDNDRVAADLQRHLAREINAEGAQEYWRIFEQLRTELGYADYLGALQRYRTEHPRTPHLMSISDFLINYLSMLARDKVEKGRYFIAASHGMGFLAEASLLRM